LGVEQALLAARAIFPRLRPSEVNTFRVVSVGHSGPPGRTVQADQILTKNT
jgi:hypothetical protein